MWSCGQSGCIEVMNNFYKSASWVDVAREVHKVLCIIEKGPHGNVVAMVTAVTKHPDFHRFKQDEDIPHYNIVICNAMQNTLAQIAVSSLPVIVETLIAKFKLVRHYTNKSATEMRELIPILRLTLQSGSLLSDNVGIVYELRFMQVLQVLVHCRWNHSGSMQDDTLVRVKRMAPGDVLKLQTSALPDTALPFSFCG